MILVTDLSIDRTNQDVVGRNFFGFYESIDQFLDDCPQVSERNVGRYYYAECVVGNSEFIKAGIPKFDVGDEVECIGNFDSLITGDVISISNELKLALVVDKYENAHYVSFNKVIQSWEK